MISFLESELCGKSRARPVRAARVQVTVRGNSKPDEMIELIVDLTSGSIIKKEHLKGRHPYIDSAYMQAAEKACRADPRIEAEIQKLKLPEGAQVVVEPWAYATDGMNDVSERTTMVRLAIFSDFRPSYSCRDLYSAGSICVYSTTQMQTTMHIHSIYVLRFLSTSKSLRFIIYPLLRMSVSVKSHGRMIIAKPTRPSSASIILNCGLHRALPRSHIK